MRKILAFATLFLLIGAVEETKKPKRVFVIIIDAFNADDVGRGDFPTFEALRKVGTYYKNCYTCPPIRSRWTSRQEDERLWATVSNHAIVTGTVFWKKGEKLQTLGHAVKEKGEAMHLATYPVYDCLNEGFAVHNTKAGKKAQRMFETAKRTYAEKTPVLSVIHPQESGDDGERRDIRSKESHHITTLQNTDKALGEFIEFLKKRGEWENSLIVITSDHGIVSFRDYRHDVHPHWLEESWKVPLLIAGPGIRKGVEAEYAELIDIAPTVCHLLGVEPPEGSIGRLLTEAIEGAETKEEPKQRMKHWMRQNLAFQKTRKRERKENFYGGQDGRCADWADFDDLDKLLEQNDRVLKRLGIPLEED